jgi:hypothetical protein
MTTYEIPPFGLTPRHAWLRQRVIDCVAALKILEGKEQWGDYKKNAINLSHELAYALTEWDKYYNDNQ